MVTFYNLEIKDGILTALAVNESSGLEENITARIDGSYHSSKDSYIIKATWGAVCELRKKKKIPKIYSIAWY